jgi:DNA repair protein RadC
METLLFDVTPSKPAKAQWCKEDRPDYKISTKGRKHLTDSELLACIINETNSLELSRSLLSQSENNLSQLAKMNYSDLRKLGLSHTKATSLMASFKLGVRREHAEMPDNVQIKCSKDVHDILSPMLIDLMHEEFWILFLSRNNKVLNKIKLSQGGISGTVTDVRIIMKKAIEFLASGIIVAHNHPSGNLNPSESDTKITQKIKEAGAMLDVPLLDHLIISEREYYSFADNGLL